MGERSGEAIGEERLDPAGDSGDTGDVHREFSGVVAGVDGRIGHNSNGTVFRIRFLGARRLSPESTSSSSCRLK